MQDVHMHRYKLLVFLVSLAIIAGVLTYSSLSAPWWVNLGILLSIIIVNAFIRRIDEDLLRIISYILMGFSAYSLVGGAYVASYSPGDPGMMFTQLAPILLFSLVNGIAVLITTEDKDIHGYTFGGCGIAIMVVMIVNDLYRLNVQTALLLMAALWIMIPLLWCYLFSELYRPDVKVTERLARAIGGAVITSPLYLIIVGVTFIAATGATPDLQAIIRAAKSNMVGPGSIILNYILSHVVIVTGCYMLLGLVMYALGYEKKIVAVKRRKEIIYIREKDEREKGSAGGKEEPDPYDQLLTEMKRSRTELREQDRIRAHQLLQRFTNEYHILHARYGDTRLSKEVKNLLRSLEEEISSR